jgi:hypothetical protein
MFPLSPHSSKAAKEEEDGAKKQEEATNTTTRARAHTQIKREEPQDLPN